MKSASLAFVLMLAAVPAFAQTPAPAPAAPAATAATGTYSVSTTRVAELLDKPALKAIFAKHFPDVANSGEIDQGRDMTLAEIVQYAPEVLTPDKMAAMDADLKALPPQ